MSVFHNIYKQNIEDKYAQIKKETQASFFTIWQSYISTVISTFNWKNLPKDVLIRQPEEALCYWGRIGFFKEGEEYKIFPAYPSGELLENGKYSKYYMVARNGKQYMRDYDDVEICYNNFNIIPSIFLINELANKSAYALQSVDVSLERAMQPPILTVENEAQFKVLSEALDKEKNKMPFRITYSEMVEGKTGLHHIFDNRANDVLALWDVYVRYRNLFYTTFGINNVEIQKRERLTEAEGSGNDEITRYTLLFDMYEQRTDFCKRVKEKFGYNLEVEINRDSATVYQLNLENSDKITDTKINISKGANLPTGGDNDEGNNPE